MVVHDEDAEVGGRRELLLDPGVTAAADLAVIEVRLARVDRDDRDAVHMQRGVALAEQLLEAQVADIPRVVLPGMTTRRLQWIMFRYSRAWRYSCLKPNVVRSPEQITIAGSSSLISEIARSIRLGTKFGSPQWMSERWAIVNVLVEPSRPAMVEV